MEKKVNFYSQGVSIEGVLYLPDGLATGEKKPGIVLCHGFTAVKELILPEVAKRFTDLGYAALIFDYRFLGGSGGEPRRRILPLYQIEDIRNAVTFLQLQPEVAAERIGLFGVSLGGAMVSYAAGVEERVKCTISMCGIGDCGRWIRDSSRLWEWNELLKQVEEDRGERVVNNRVRYVQASEIVPEPPSTQALFTDIVKRYPQWSREITFESAEALIAFKPESVVHKIAPRAMMWVHGDADDRVSPEESKSMYAQAQEPKRLIFMPGFGHSDILVGAGLEKILPEIASWYGEHL